MLFVQTDSPAFQIINMTVSHGMSSTVLLCPNCLVGLVVSWWKAPGPQDYNHWMGNLILTYLELWIFKIGATVQKLRHLKNDVPFTVSWWNGKWRLCLQIYENWRYDYKSMKILFENLHFFPLWLYVPQSHHSGGIIINIIAMQCNVVLQIYGNKSLKIKKIY